MPAPSRSRLSYFLQTLTPILFSSILDDLLYQRDYIVGPNYAWFQDLCVESAESPARAGWIASLDLSIVKGALNPRSVDVQCRAGAAQLGDFEYGIARTVALADTHQAAVEPGSGQILAEGAGIERETLRDQLIDSFGSNDENRLAGTAVDRRMCPAIPPDSLTRNLSFGNRQLGDAAGGDVDLEDRAGHAKSDICSESITIETRTLASFVEENTEDGVNVKSFNSLTDI